MDPYILDQFKKNQRRVRSSALVALAFAVVAFLVRDQGGALQNIVFALTFVVLMAFALITLIFWRCPVCKKPLGKNLTSERCPNPRCGVSFK